MAVPCHHWPDMLQFLDSPITLAEETRCSEADMEPQGSFGPFEDPVVVDHRPGGMESCQPGPSNRALPKFKAWEDERPYDNNLLILPSSAFSQSPADLNSYYEQTKDAFNIFCCEVWARNPFFDKWCLRYHPPWTLAIKAGLSNKQKQDKPNKNKTHGLVISATGEDHYAFNASFSVQDANHIQAFGYILSLLFTHQHRSSHLQTSAMPGLENLVGYYPLHLAGDLQPQDPQTDQ
ncbi:hypothetical protein CSKR_110374 [Clonorchis sinensis]|uniref:Uncharacterized protein n=1 Tax=Clonorchis sinensis TaxID=79923 RepID=A0A3R7CXK9_CLOSI|nr:hypothetical protein CSKR_110374 [Clonorchis sinensis]